MTSRILANSGILVRGRSFSGGGRIRTSVSRFFNQGAALCPTVLTGTPSNETIHLLVTLQREAVGGRPTHVYFVQAGEDGPVKIGIADDIEKRLASLQVGSPDELRLLAWHSGPAALEKRIHEYLTEDWLRGEWFYPSEAVLGLARGYREFHDSLEGFQP